MSSIFNNFLKQVATGDQIRDFKHASRLFVDNNLLLSPKYDWLYHVFFDVNPMLSRVAKDTNKLTETGMLVKNVDLPRYSIDSKVYNAYNRPAIVQTKFRPKEIQITFHDDQTNVVRSFWYDYYSYYYRDSDAGYSGNGLVNPSYYQQSKYDKRDNPLLYNFGYSPRAFGFGKSVNQYLESIRIYSLHQKKFSEYTLVNPIVTEFSHGSHNAGSNGILEHTMTISFETVLYGSGYASRNSIKGFADLHYDKSPSPLTPAGGGTNSIMGPGGILSAVDSITQQGYAGNYGGAAFTLFRAFEKNRNVDLRGLAQTELVNAGLDILNRKDPRDRFFFPSRNNLNDLVSPGGGGLGSSNKAGPGSATSNGSSVNLGGTLLTSGLTLAVAGAPLALTATAIAAGAFLASNLSSTLSSNISGLSTNSTGQVTGGAEGQVYTVQKQGSNVGNVIVATLLAPFDFLSSQIQKSKQAREEKVRREQQIAAERQGSGGSSTLPAGVAATVSNASGAPVFNSDGTYFTPPGNILNQTSYRGFQTASSETVANDAASSVANGQDGIRLTPGQSYAGQYYTGASSTNPQPNTI